ncbi:MAG TPA: hypothetical protein VG821_10045 [Rhizomicrobium sp.]|jgi:peroxiredoxin|nr:hypothetical protein [Rhizomicrobium sp.]
MPWATRSKPPIGAAMGFLAPYADRTSYVVTQEGRIAFAYRDLDPDQHVSLTLKAVRAITAAH